MQSREFGPSLTAMLVNLTNFPSGLKYKFLGLWVSLLHLFVNVVISLHLIVMRLLLEAQTSPFRYVYVEKKKRNAYNLQCLQTCCAMPTLFAQTCQDNILQSRCDGNSFLCRSCPRRTSCIGWPTYPRQIFPCWWTRQCTGTELVAYLQQSAVKGKKWEWKKCW